MRREFPGHPVEEIEIGELVSTHDRRVRLAAAVHYLPSIVRGRRRIDECAARTPYYFRRLRKDLLKRLAQKPYVFSFQTQSLWDASAPGRPHFVYTDHTHLANLQYPDFRREQLFSDAWIGLERTIYHNATLTFTRTDNITRSVIEQYGCPEERVVCVGAGSNSDPWSVGPTNAKKYASKQVLFVGVDWERKGGPLLARAFEMVLKTHPDARLTIVGCQPALSLPNCTIVGRVPLSEVGAYYEQAAVFCLPTRREPFGIVFLEAMAHGLPVVGTRLGPMPDFITDDLNGYLVDADDASGLASVLNRLLSQPSLCQALGREGQRLTAEYWNWQHTAARLGRHIRECIPSLEAT